MDWNTFATQLQAAQASNNYFLAQNMTTPATQFAFGNTYINGSGSNSLFGGVGTGQLNVVGDTFNMLGSVDQQASSLSMQMQLRALLGIKNTNSSSNSNNLISTLLGALGGGANGLASLLGANGANKQSSETDALNIIRNKFSRFDENDDNVLDADELEEAADYLEENFGGLYSDSMENIMDELESLSKADTTDGFAGLTKKDIAAVKDLLEDNDGDFEDTIDSLSEVEENNNNNNNGNVTPPPVKGNRTRLSVIVDNLYQDVLGRSADADGLKIYVDQLVAGTKNISQIRAELMQNEFNPVVKNDTTKLRTVLNNMYQEILGRDADAFGLDYYTSEITSGRMTLDVVRARMENGDQYSNEFKNTVCKDDAKLTTVVSNLYIDILGRNADAEGLKIYKDQLIAGTKTISQIRAELEASSEFAGLRA
jgi:hypothetical protein